tara:strand:- start:950 stop:1579 length:630 start_codon:yes stop_codon:yes gene_type:complete
MKLILVSQRVSIEPSYKERRDCLDQRWSLLLEKAGLIGVMMPNNINAVQVLLQNINPNGLLLTGGNSLTKYDGDAPERDKAEVFALKYAIKKNIPVLGVCRGMQLIQDYFGVELEKIKGHVATRIELSHESGKFGSLYKKLSNVNAYHNLGTKYTSDSLKVSAKSSRGVVMAIEHSEKNIYGCMWHPEREEPINDIDIDHIKNIFGVNL